MRNFFLPRTTELHQSLSRLPDDRYGQSGYRPLVEYELREGHNRRDVVEPTITANPRGLDVGVSEHHESREDPDGGLTRAVLVRARFPPDTLNCLHILGANRNERKDKDAGSAGLRVHHGTEVLLPSGSLQKHSTVHWRAECRLARCPAGRPSANYDKGRGEESAAMQVLCAVHVLRRPVLSHRDAVPVAEIER